MNKEEAIKYLKEMKDECNDTIHKVRYVTQEEVLDMAIKALEQEPSGDLISRQAVIELINNSALDLGYENANYMMQDNILSLPSVQPKTKMGHWMPSHIPESILDECSECGFSCGAFTFNYCPNCGAKMESEDKE